MGTGAGACRRSFFNVQIESRCRLAAGIEVPRRVIALIVVTLGFAAACAQMLGEVEIAGRETRIGSNQPDAGPVPLPVICELGTTKCEDRLLQLCTDGGTAWVTWQACATAALCKASDLSTVAACVPPTCSADQMSCSGPTLRLCNEDRTGWAVFDTCKTAAHCDAGKRQCLPSPCDPGDRRCNVGVLERCRDDQLDWEKLDECASNEVCEATVSGAPLGRTAADVTTETLPPSIPLAANSEGPTECSAPACLSREVRCKGVQLLACNEGLTDFDVAEECATPVLCDASIAYSGIRGSPRCVRPKCDVNQHRCSDTGVLEVCNEDRTDFKAIEECIGAPFCSAVAADNGQPGCRDAPCESGQEQCNGAEIQRCSDDRTRFDAVTTCETRGLCDDSNPRDAFCRPPVCQRGPLSGTEFRCQGTVLQRCNDQHTGYDTLNTCATPGLCNAGLGFSGCQAPACAPGQTRCSGDFLQVCNDQRTGFDNLERCGQGACDSSAGRCSDPCIVGSARCNSQGQLEECRDRLVGRQITALCSSPQLCDAMARACRQPPPGCTADGVHQCVRQGANTLLQVCSDGRSRFATVDTCSGGEICDPNNAAPNQNVCDQCAQNSQPTCQGDDLVSCSADGITPTRVTCPNGCQVVDIGPDRCRNCVLGSATCDGAGLLVCVSSGATNEFRERRACTTAASCQATLTACNAGRNGENCNCRPGVCSAGQRDCQGNQPVRCSDDLTAFVPDGPSCGTRVCFPRPGSIQQPAGTCGCRPGEDVQCVGGILQTCTPTGVFQNDPRFVRGGVLCLPGPNGTGQRALSCNGNVVRDDTCTVGCSVEKGCAECDPSTFVSTCDTETTHTVCNGGDIIEGQSCGTPSNACLQVRCEDSGDCNPSVPQEDGTPCGNGGLCENGVCARCGDSVINGDEQCDTTIARSCPNGQSGQIRCVGCQEVRECCGDGVVNGSEGCDTPTARNCPNGQIGSIRCVGCQEVSDCAVPICGDGTCTAAAGESTSTCPADCGDRCGDGVATGTEACDRNDLKGAACGAGQAGSVSCSATCTLVRDCQPIICAPNAPRCDGDNFRLCNAAGTAEPVQQTCGGGSECVNPTTCNLTAGGCIGGGIRAGQPCTGGLCSSTGQCVPVCTANAVRCDGDRVFVCNAAGTQEVLQDTCGGGSECVNPTTCSVAARGCTGGGPRTGQPCTGGGSCDIAGRCVPPLPPACSANTARCDGNTVLVCNAGGTAETPTQTCGGGDACHDPTSCVGGACVGGGVRTGSCLQNNQPGTCQAGVCIPDCGNGSCAAPETSESCPQDCPVAPPPDPSNGNGQGNGNGNGQGNGNGPGGNGPPGGPPGGGVDPGAPAG
jgi:hypothetical protein